MLLRITWLTLDCVRAERRHNASCHNHPDWLAPVDCDVGWVSPRRCPVFFLLLSRYKGTSFSFCLALENYVFKSSNKGCNDVMRIRVAKEKLFFRKVWRNGYRNWDNFTYPNCGYSTCKIYQKMIQSRMLLLFSRVSVHLCIFYWRNPAFRKEFVEFCIQSWDRQFSLVDCI